MDEKFMKRIAAFVKAAEDIAGDAPRENELEAGGNYEWAEFFAEVANVVNAYANIPRKENP